MLRSAIALDHSKKKERGGKRPALKGRATATTLRARGPLPDVPFRPVVSSIAPLPLPVVHLEPVRQGRPQVALKPPKVRKVFGSTEMDAIAVIFQLLKLMLRVHDMQASPEPGDMRAGDWVGTLVNHFTDYADEQPTLRRATPKAFEISAADYMFELVQQLRRRDEFMALVVVTRAAGVAWKKIAALDPGRRKSSMLKYIRLTGAWELVKLDSTRKNLVAKVTKNP
jgi:hypothetical protein